MTRARTLFALCFFLIGLAFVAARDYKTFTQSKIEAKLVDTSELRIASKIEIVFDSQPLKFIRNNQDWQLTEFNGQAVRDSRANSGLVNHLLDLVQNMTGKDAKPFDQKLASEYGLLSPILKISLLDQKQEVHFGKRNLAGSRAFAYFPHQNLFAEVPAHALDLLESKTPLDFRDRRITTFETDDIEKLKLRGRCHSLELTRDGDQWKGYSQVQTPKIENWLDEFLGLKYVAVDDRQTSQPQKPIVPWCVIELTGRKNHAETLSVFNKDGALWAINTALPAIYRLPKGFFEQILPPI